MKQFSPNRLFHRVKMPNITKIFIEFRPAEIGDKDNLILGETTDRLPDVGVVDPLRSILSCVRLQDRLHLVLLRRWPAERLLNRRGSLPCRFWPLRQTVFLVASAVAVAAAVGRRPAPPKRSAGRSQRL